MKSYLSVLFLLGLWQMASSFHVEASHRLQTPITQSRSASSTSKNSVTEVHLAPLYMEGVRVRSSKRDQLWTRSAATKESCADECPLGYPNGCVLAQFDSQRRLCTGFGQHAELEFLYGQNYFAYTEFTGVAKRYHGMTFRGEELTYDSTALTEWLQIDWTEQLCTNVCQLHPRCGVAIFNTRTKKCTVKKIDSRYLPTRDASSVSVSMESSYPREITYAMD